MKKNILLAALSIALAFMISSCSDNTDNDMAPNRVYIVHGGENGAPVILYNTGIKNIYNLHLYRSGKEGNAATAKVKVLTQDDVDAYNQTNGTNYTVLPSSGYSLLNTEVSFGGGNNDVDASVEIEFDPVIVKNILESNPNITYVIPVQIENASVEISVDKSIAFIRPSVKEPLVYMGLNGFTSYSYKPEDQVQSISLQFPVQVDFKNIWDITCGLTASQEVLDEYNNREGTFYTMLPAEAYSLSPSVVIPNGQKKAMADLNLDGTKISYGNYVLPVTLKSVSQFNIDPDRDSYLIGIFIEAPVLDRTGWTVEVNSIAGSESIGKAEALIDGLVTTYWHSRYGSSGTGVTNQLPYDLVIDMKSEKTITSIDLQQRTGTPYRDTKSGTFYISSDNTSWTRIGAFELKQADGVQAFGVLVSKGRYIKVVIETSYRAQNASLSEIDMHGF